MKIVECGATPTQRAPEVYFTGTVWQDRLIAAEEPARVQALIVRFDPGARTAWHTHPLGQTLHVIAGKGLAQSWGGPIREIRAGDTIWFEPGEKHWHGAGPDTAMTHIAIQEALDGKPAEWLEKVTDAQYSGR